MEVSALHGVRAAKRHAQLGGLLSARGGHLAYGGPLSAELIVKYPSHCGRYLFVRTLGDGARDTDVKRLHALREAFELLDIEDETFCSIREFILRACVH